MIFAWASAQSDQSLRLCAQWVGKDPSFLHADNENSNQADAQADLSLRWAHMPFCLFVFLSFFLFFLDAMYICNNKAGSFFEAVYFFQSFFLSFFSLNNGMIRRGRGYYEYGAEVVVGPR